MDLFLDQILHKYAALTEVALTYALLWAIGRLLARESNRLENQIAATPTKSCDGVLRGLHVSGVTEELIGLFESLAAKKDTLKLAMYLAIYQPTIREVEELLQTAEELRLCSQIDKTDNDAFLAMAQSDSDVECIKRLSQDELRSIRNLHNKTRKLINRAFIVRFGDLLFMENFIMYSHLSRRGATVYDIPKDNELRRMFEVFVITGLAIHGRDIPIEDRLSLLSFQELQDMARELDMGSDFDSVDEAISKLAPLPNVSVRLAKMYPSSRLFLLKKENWDSQEIEKEWAGYNATAKIFCAVKTEELAVAPKSLSYA